MTMTDSEQLFNAQEGWGPWDWIIVGGRVLKVGAVVLYRKIRSSR